MAGTIEVGSGRVVAGRTPTFTLEESDCELERSSERDAGGGASASAERSVSASESESSLFREVLGWGLGS